MQERTEGNGGIGPMLLVVGGALAALGVFLPWVTVSGGLADSSLSLSDSATGLDANAGKLVAVCAIVAVALGILCLVRGAERWVGVVAIIVGVIVVGAALYNIVTMKSQVVDEILKQAPAGTEQAVIDQARTLIERFIDQGAISIKAGIGLFFSAAGGVVALLGGVLLLGADRSAGTPTIEAGEVSAGPPMTGFDPSPTMAPPAGAAGTVESPSPSAPVPPADAPAPPVDVPSPAASPTPEEPPAPEPPTSAEGDLPTS